MTKNKNKRVVLLDVHAILHRSYHALPDFKTSAGVPTGGLYGLSAMLIKIINDLEPDYLFACYDLPEATFRKKMYEGYKAGRPKADDELVSQMISSREVFKAMNIPIYEKGGFEADDMIGTITEKLSGEKGVEVIIASGDLDTLQLVSGDKIRVYTLKKGINDTILYNEKAVVERFGFTPDKLADYKGLRGDPSDNIIGIKGIGEKTGETLIQNFGTLENIYKILEKGDEPFLKAGIKERIIGLLKDGKDEAMFSKKLATIRRDAPIDFAMPKEKWCDGVSSDAVKKLFIGFEFKNLGARFEGALKKCLPAQAGAGIELTPKLSESIPNAKPAQGRPASGGEEVALGAKVDPLRLRKAQIALWLIDSDNTEPTVEDIFEFAKTLDFNKAEEVLLARIKKDGLEKVYNEIELPIIPIIEEAEMRGILIDEKHLNELSVDYHKRLSALEKKIFEQAGGEFNMNSPKQLGEVLFDRMKLTAKGLRKTAGGARSTRESELEKLREGNPIIEDILLYREFQKLLSTYIDAIPPKLDEEKRLHAKLNQTGTATGRMSSNDPNIQNIPIRGEFGAPIRNAFIAPKGYKIASFDYSQIEMRALAWLTGDEFLTQAFKEGKDIHAEVAAKVFGVEEDKVTGEMRRRAKVINFGIIYGMGVRALKKNLGSTLEEAERFYEEYFNKFPKVREYFEKVKNQAREKGYTTTYFGRRRYFPNINSRLPYLRSESERMAMNAPIQGTATADIIKIAMVRAEAGLKAEKLQDKANLLMQVHDELVYEIKDDADLARAVKTIKNAMENAVEAGMPFLVGAEVGRSWGELEPFEKK